jgi:hypothetical protein
MSPSGTTCLLSDCCFSEQALCKFNEACCSSTTRISSSSFYLIFAMISLENHSFGVNQQSLTHQLEGASHS